MKDRFSDEFMNALERQDINAIRSIPKSDLHNHFALGGNRGYIKEITGIWNFSASFINLKAFR